LARDPTRRVVSRARAGAKEERAVADLSVHVEGQEYDLTVDAAGVPGVGEILGIEEVPGSWLRFRVVSRTFNFGASGTSVIVEADKVGAEPEMAPPTFQSLDDPDPGDERGTWREVQ
jgi:hypothetical protein